MKNIIVTETDRLLLRHLEIPDIDAICRIICDPEVMLFSNGVKTPTEAAKWLEDCIESYSKFGYWLWAVIEKSTRSLVGYCGLIHFPELSGKTEHEIGFRFQRSSWSQGYATEAALAVRDYAFDTLSIPRLVALVDPSNTASLRVVEKIGMVYEKNVMLPGYKHPDRLYAVFRQQDNDSLVIAPDS